LISPIQGTSSKPLTTDLSMNAQPQDEGDQHSPSEQDPTPQLAPKELAGSGPSNAFSVVGQDIPLALEQALVRNLEAFQQLNLATLQECKTVAETVKGNWLSGKGCDPVECLAKLNTDDEDMLNTSIESISSKLAETLTNGPTRIPFAGKLITPNSLYEKNPYIESICKLMGVPVAYAEDLDVLALASINPYFMEALSVAISDYTMQLLGTQPIISMIRLDYASWVAMYSKHFREEVDYDRI